MRVRVLLIGTVVALLALAGLLVAGTHARQQPGVTAAGRMAPEPAPEPVAPAIVSSALTTTVSAHHLAVDARCDTQPWWQAETTCSALPTPSYSTSQPRTFPLRI